MLMTKYIDFLHIREQKWYYNYYYQLPVWTEIDGVKESNVVIDEEIRMCVKDEEYKLFKQKTISITLTK